MNRLNFLIIRILGNDVPNLHGRNQTLENTRFALEHESLPRNVEKVYCLNRISSRRMKRDLMALLDNYNAAYFEIPFEKEEFFALGKPESLDRQGTYLHNLYLINVNGARNRCLEYGLAGGRFDWVLPLDSNSFFTTRMWQGIESGIKLDDELLILPQIRINRNRDVLDTTFSWERFPTYEPQIGFHRNSNLQYSPMLPYGGASKAELLRVCGVPGPWENWRDNELSYGIPDRSAQSVRFNTVGGVIRLSSHNSNIKWRQSGALMSKIFSRFTERRWNQRILKEQMTKRDEGLVQMLDEIYSETEVQS